MSGNVHRDSIERLAAVGIVKGRTPSIYEPRDPVTSEQLASLLIQAIEWAGQTEFSGDGPYFEDVSPAHAANVDAAFELGLMRGYDDRTFHGSAPTRRDQTATALVRSLVLLTGS